MIRGEQYIDPSIQEAINNPSIDLARLAVGSIIHLKLAEGQDLQRQLQLTTVLETQTQPDTLAVLRVIDSIVPSTVIEKNAKYQLGSIDFIGELLHVEGACRYRARYVPPITLVHLGHIDKHSHLLTTIATPANTRASWMKYIPFVEDVAIST